jgi:thiamine-phosphate pyrophosphorylase
MDRSRFESVGSYHSRIPSAGRDMTSPFRRSLRGLYPVTPDEPDTARLLLRVLPVLALKPALLQYRNKAAPPALRREQALALLAVGRRAGVPLIVNDDVALALEIGAAGVHLGAADGDIAQARQRLGRDAIIGASCYDDLDRAAAAAAAGADYLAFGAMFASATKPQARRAPLSVLRDAARFGLPRVAIGGLTPDNAAEAIAAGADLVAVVGAVFDAPDPAAATRAFLSRFEDPT